MEPYGLLIIKCLSASESVPLTVCPSVYLFARVSVPLGAYPPVHRFICVCVRQCVYLIEQRLDWVSNSRPLKINQLSFYEEYKITNKRTTSTYKYMPFTLISFWYHEQNFRKNWDFSKVEIVGKKHNFYTACEYHVQGVEAQVRLKNERYNKNFISRLL